MTPIRIAIAGIGNCASALLQGIEYYKQPTNAPVGLLHPLIGGYAPGDIQVVAAFDIDARKVGQPLESALVALPNCTTRFIKQFPSYGVEVSMGPVLDGVAAHMAAYPDEQRFLVAKREPVNVASVLKQSNAEILLNYLQIGRAHV